MTKLSIRLRREWAAFILDIATRCCKRAAAWRKAAMNKWIDAMGETTIQGEG